MASLVEAPIEVTSDTDDSANAEVEGVVLSTRRVGARVAFVDLDVGVPGEAWAVARLVEAVLKVGAPAFADAAAVAGACRGVLRPGNVVRLQGRWCGAHTPGARCVDRVGRLSLVTRWVDARPGCVFRRPALGEAAPDLRSGQAGTAPGRSRNGRGAANAKHGGLNQTTARRLPCTPVVALSSPRPRAWPPQLAMAATRRFSAWALVPHPRSAGGCCVHATVPGFEAVCAAELVDKLGAPAAAVTAAPGHVSCRLGSLDACEAAARLLSLKSVEHLYAALFDGDVPGLLTHATDGGGADASLAALRAAIRSVEPATWRACLKVWWAACRNHRDARTSDGDDEEPSALPDDVCLGMQGLTFKVEKQRVGRHAFSSTQLAQHAYVAAAARLGPGWQGALEHPDLTLVVKVKGAHLFVGVPLTRRGEVLWKQQAGGVGCEGDDYFSGGTVSSDGVSSEGLSAAANQPPRLQPLRPPLLQPRAWVATPLRPTVAFGLVQCAGPLACGDLLVDPCCGGGTVGEVAAQEYASRKRVFCISGDADLTAVACAAHNVKRASSAAAAAAAAGGGAGGGATAPNRVLVDVVRWDATRLPLRAGVVDRVVTDLPFGKRCGRRRENHGHLYPRFFAECARVLRRVAGTSDRGGNSAAAAAARVVVMSADRGSLKRGVESAATAVADGAKGRTGQTADDGEGSGLQVHAEHHVNMGGLNAVVLVLGHATPT